MLDKNLLSKFRFFSDIADDRLSAIAQQGELLDQILEQQIPQPLDEPAPTANSNGSVNQFTIRSDRAAEGKNLRPSASIRLRASIGRPT